MYDHELTIAMEVSQAIGNIYASEASRVVKGSLDSNGPLMIIPNKPVSSIMIDQFEEIIGSTFPEDFKKFLLTYNGGETPNTYIRSKKLSSDIRAFYGLGNVPYGISNIEVKVLNSKPVKLLPCAIDSYGNTFIIALNDGSIYFNNHESSKNSIIKVAKSFKEFIGMCRSNEISDFARMSPAERGKQFSLSGKPITSELKNLWNEEYNKYRNASQVIVEI